MARPSSGAISLNTLHTEAGGTSGTVATINDSDIRNLIGKASGTEMSFSEWYAFYVTLTSTNVGNIDVRTLALNAGWDANAHVVFTINSGVQVRGSTQNNSTAAVRFYGSFPSGATFINNGTVIGRGGAGGAGGAYGTGLTPAGGAGVAGGKALQIYSTVVPFIFDNRNGYLYGGGGGGGGGGAGYASRTGNSDDPQTTTYSAGGGGGGGGRTNASYSASGGAGGNTPAAEYNVTQDGTNGGAGSTTSGGSAGAGGDVGYADGGGGREGGTYGAAGTAGRPTDNPLNQQPGGAGGAGGYAVYGISYITVNLGWGTYMGSRTG